MASRGAGRPSSSALRRAISTAYYALFHAIASDAADRLVGGVGAGRMTPAWVHVYRSLNHGEAKKACQQVRQLGFSNAVCDVADAFVALQQVRHRADYDPTYRVTAADTNAGIARARNAITDLMAANLGERKAFAVQLLLKRH